MPASNALSSSALPGRATRIAMTFTEVAMILFLGEVRGTDEPHPGSSPWSGRPACAISQRLDELRGNRMIGSRILTSDELAIDHHVGLEINGPSAHLAASRCECVWHIEIHFCVKDVVFDPLFF